MSRKIEVIPLEQVDGILFGTKRSEVRQRLGTCSEFLKSETSDVTTDDFGFCHVFYNKNDEMEAVEIFEEVEVYINGIKVFPIPLEEALKLIKDAELDDYDGLLSKTQSIGIYAPDEDEPESILFGVKDYYNDL